MNQEQTESNQQVIQQAAQTIREKYNQPLSLNDLLRQAHMSRSYFLRLFRRYMGTTPYNYLISTRITQAKALLALTDRSVSEIGREVGFGDASNFSARFSAAVGQSPMQYRRSALHQAEKEQEGYTPVYKSAYVILDKSVSSRYTVSGNNFRTGGVA